MIINASLQVIPLTNRELALPIVDKAIALIQQSGLTYIVGAFETTIEGEYEPVQQLIKQIEDFCYAQQKVQFLVYKKLHLCGGADILVRNKTSKFKH